MATVDDSVINVADSYAAALLELSEQQGNSAEVLQELADLVAGTEQDPVLAQFLLSAVVDDDARREGIEKSLRGRVTDLLVDTLQVLNTKGRAAILPTLYERYRLALEEARSEVDVHVTTACPLPEGLRNQLLEVLRTRTGLEPRLIERVDEDMLGGLVVHIGDEKLDGSVSHQLHTLRETLKERASREIHAGKDYFEEVEC